VNLVASVRKWLGGLAPRERNLVNIAAVLAAVAVVYAATVMPARYVHARQVARIEDKQKDLEWMREAAPRVALIVARGGGETNESLMVLADRTSRASGLGGAIRDQSPAGDNSLKLRLEGASFDSMIGWLAALDANYGVSVSAATIDAASAPGLVNATITLTHGARAAR
jgi:general secretion pathway protein M